MKVAISGFRCYSEVELEFKDGITLIQGTSGIGKSTIFEAIYWCLYGSLRNIYHPLHPNKKCIVTITTPTITITRSTKPASLIIEYQGQTYHEQEVINRIFGTKDVWLSNSYLSQGSRCHWLDINADERLATIEYIVYSDQTPDVYLERATNHANKINEQVASRLSTYEVKSKMFQEQAPYDPKDVVSNLKEQEEQLQTYKRELKAKQLQLQQQTLNLGKLEQLKLELANNIKERSELDTVPYEKIAELEEQIKEYQRLQVTIQEYQKQNQLYERARLQYQQLDPNNIIGSLTMIPNINDIHKQEVEYQLYLKREQEIQSLRSMLQEEPTIETQRILSQQILDQGKYDTYKHLLEQEQVLLKQVTKLPEPSLERLNQLKTKISGQGYHQALECPTCKTKLELTGKCLIPFNHPSIEEIKAAQEEIQLLTTSIQLHQQLSSLRAKMIPCPEVHYNVAFLNQQLNIIQKLLSIQHVNVEAPLISSKILQAYINFKSLPEAKPIPELPNINVTSLRDQINRMHATNLKIKQLDAKKLQLEADIIKIESSLDNNLSTIIQSLEHEIQTLEQDIKRYQYATKMHKEYQTLIQEYEVLQAKYQEHYIANQLVSIIEHTEYTLLEDTINLFNQCLSEVTASLFDEPITVKLELWKTSNKRTKPNIHLQISYKGIETNNYSSLSGGEATRLSLALMIAFWIVHPSPFLLIDESLSSINHQLRDQAIVTFKRFITVPVLIILHETSSEGLFDHVLQL